MTTYYLQTYACPNCGNEIDDRLMGSTSSFCYPDGKIPDGDEEVADELGCRRCNSFFLRSTAKKLGQDGDAYSDPVDGMRIPLSRMEFYVQELKKSLHE